ncbi:MAG TPA: RNA polymerase sigma factor [Candidatus Angelobacter sp.]|jgi:RNA polymerase sigma-70 factor (ECF subfamily)|nr:RNA polymerase sigma factor [Candidatus Angelobacter sp.]
MIDTATTVAVESVRNSTAREDDDRLIERFRRGDVGAFEQIYRNHHRYVQMQARRVIADAHRAEDIAQEAFLRLVRQLLANDGQIKLRAWLHRTTTNLAIDEHRRSRTLQQYQEQRSPIDELQRTLDRGDRGHPEQEAESGEVRSTIRRVIETMPARYRAILALRELEGLDYISIARAMNLSVSAVESLLFRARRRFTEEYQQVAGVEPRPSAPRRRRRGMPPIVPD